MPEIYQIILIDEAKADFTFWKKKDKLIFKRIELLVDSITHTLKFGIGKPEKLKHEFSGFV